ncbi:hypothetical protein SDC9_63694 [bioreactor metagenome]|uniref:Uncharacterized protein n=1 Tax=bioreactor metagenome TaxID=1076179 RepID=A0A644XM80_9ZZZZ
MKMILPPPLSETSIGPLSDLEAGLCGPDAPAVRVAAMGRVESLERTLRAALAKGVSSSEYPQYAALLEACQASREVLQVEVRSI